MSARYRRQNGHFCMLLDALTTAARIDANGSTAALLGSADCRLLLSLLRKLTR